MRCLQHLQALPFVPFARRIWYLSLLSAQFARRKNFRERAKGTDLNALNGEAVYSIAFDGHRGPAFTIECSQAKLYTDSKPILQ